MPFPRASRAVIAASTAELSSASLSPLARLVTPEQFVAPEALLRDVRVCDMMERFKEERALLAKTLENLLRTLLGEVITVSLHANTFTLACACSIDMC
jgi:hypothetical protein